MIRLVGMLILFVAAAAYAGGLDIYLVRHGETVGNVTGDYSDENQRTFSDKGREQVAALAGRLEPYAFDAILVSPLWRTQQTILPYLRGRGLQGELWPELAESDCGVTGDETPADSLPFGEPIERVDTNVFQYRDDATMHVYEAHGRRASLAQLRKGVDLVLKEFSGSGKSILLVGHGCTGARMAELFLGLKPRGRFTPANTALFHIRVEDDGSAELLLMNDRKPNFFDRFILTDGRGPEIPGFVNLAGMWSVRKDDEADRWLNTRVPGSWEKDALPEYDGVAWYRHDFEIDPATRAVWGNRDVVLAMGGIDDADETFLNGTRVGASGTCPPNEVTAYRTPRFYPIPTGLLASSNEITIRVCDWMGDGGLWRAPVLLGPADALPPGAMAPSAP
jgi:broad specificity phosphatase PhoE